MNKYQAEFDDLLGQQMDLNECHSHCPFVRNCKIPIYLGETHEIIIGWTDCPKLK